jgi:DNA mismatch repair protein MutS2
MNKKVLHTLEYDKILEKLASYATNDAGRAMCEGLLPSSDPDKIAFMQQQTADAFARILRSGTMSFGGIVELRPALKRLELGSTLSIEELLSVRSLLQVTKRALLYAKDNHGDEILDSLTERFRALDDVPTLFSEIDRCILSADEISDDASPTLKSIRRQIASMGDRIRSQLNSMLNQAGMQTYLQDHVITMRGDRYCLPVKAEYRNQVPGMVHDQSSTGATLFIEPAAVVKLNNDLKELYLSEQEEIAKILAALSAMVAEHAEAIRLDQSTLFYLDFVFAKGQLAEAMHASMPDFNSEHRIHLKKARHPLLDPEHVVPINLPLGEDYDQLIITGPNTGGKTVSLKTVGLLTLMGQAGLHIPASEHSQLSVFNQIYADIGDEQSIEQSLSTFSSHMTNIVSILKKADENSLVLFDELCAGTDPTEGAALAIAILRQLHDRKITTMSTTHYSEIKVYALSTPGVENASCEFDVASLSPTYRLLIGVPGKSNAFAISKKLGLSDKIIEDAKERMKEEDEAFEDLIADLEIRKRRIEDMESETERLNKQAHSLKQSLDSRLEKNDEMRNRILNEAREEAAKILQEAKTQADQSIRNINKYGSAQDPNAIKKLEQERTKLRQQMNKNTTSKKKEKPQREVSHPDPKSLKIGDYVKVLSFNTKGTVHTLPDAKGNLTVQMGILKTKVNVRDLQMMQEPAVTNKYVSSSKGSSVRANKSYNISPEINLIGKNADDAIAELDKYLDDAFLANLSSVRIVHGKGSGILRKAVQRHLKTLNYIKNYHDGVYGEGDSGVTIAEFDHGK